MKITLFLFSCFLIVCACTKAKTPPVHSLIPALEKSVLREEGNLAKIAERLKNLEFDAGQKNSLLEEKELANSRMARLKSEIERERNRLGISTPPPAEGGGHH